MFGSMSRVRAFARGLAHCQRGLAAVEFVMIAPILLSISFSAIVYSFYFMALFGVREAAAEGARAAVTGLSTAERTNLARTGAQAVMGNYQFLQAQSDQAPQISATRIGTGQLEVKVSYDISGSPIMRAGSLLPLPNPVLSASVVVANGSY